MFLNIISAILEIEKLKIIEFYFMRRNIAQQWQVIFREKFPNKTMCCKITNIGDVQYGPVGREEKIIK